MSLLTTQTQEGTPHQANYWEEAGLRGGFYEARWRKQGTEDPMTARIGKGALTVLMAG